MSAAFTALRCIFPILFVWHLFNYCPNGIIKMSIQSFNHWKSEEKNKQTGIRMEAFAHAGYHGNRLGYIWMSPLFSCWIERRTLRWKPAHHTAGRALIICLLSHLCIFFVALFQFPSKPHALSSPLFVQLCKEGSKRSLIKGSFVSLNGEEGLLFSLMGSAQHKCPSNNRNGCIAKWNIVKGEP